MRKVLLRIAAITGTLGIIAAGLAAAHTQAAADQGIVVTESHKDYTCAPDLPGYSGTIQVRFRKREPDTPQNVITIASVYYKINVPIRDRLTRSEKADVKYTDHAALVDGEEIDELKLWTDDARQDGEPYRLGGPYNRRDVGPIQFTFKFDIPKFADATQCTVQLPGVWPAGFSPHPGQAFGYKYSCIDGGFLGTIAFQIGPAHPTPENPQGLIEPNDTIWHIAYSIDTGKQRSGGPADIIVRDKAPLSNPSFDTKNGIQDNGWYDFPHFAPYNRSYQGQVTFKIKFNRKYWPRVLDPECNVTLPDIP